MSYYQCGMILKAVTICDIDDPPLWARWGNKTTGKSHGGIEFYIHAFIEAAKRNIGTALDVYDAAAWSSITPLSEQSIGPGNETVEFQDFTLG